MVLCIEEVGSFFFWYVEVEKRKKNLCCVVLVIFPVEAEETNSVEEKRLKSIEKKKVLKGTTEPIRIDLTLARVERCCPSQNQRLVKEKQMSLQSKAYSGRKETQRACQERTDWIVGG